MDKYLTMIFALMITVAIFSLGLSLNYMIDNKRVAEIENSLKKQEINFYSTLLKDELTIKFGHIDCEAMNRDIERFKESLAELGRDLLVYRSKSFFRKGSFDILKSNYFYTKLKLYLYVTKYNELCSSIYKPVIFFYEEEKEDDLIQGYILSEYAKKDNYTIIFSFDINYGRNVFLEYMKTEYNLTRTPAIIYNNTVYKRTIYEGELREIFKD